jgi:outer membrane protein assembly factor BamB
LQGQASNPACENDGGVTSAGACAAFLTALSSSTGDVVAELDVLVPQEPYASAVGYGTMALAFDGSFFLGSASQDTPGGGVAHASVDGALLWQWPELAQDEGFQLLPPLLVGQDDGVVALGNGEILRFDVGGNQLWQEDLDAQTAAIDAQGDVVALTSPTGDDLALVTVDPTGLVVRTVALGAPQVNATQLALAGDGTTVLLLANEVASPGLTKAAVQILAIDTSGQTRWTTPLDVTLEYDPAALTTHYGLFVDGAGTVVVTAGAITGIDLSTGAILWTLQPPNAHACLRPAVLGAGGAILASQCDGTVFLARDP